MKVMAINSSARVGKESKTEIVLDHLVKGMREAGADVDVVFGGWMDVLRSEADGQLMFLEQKYTVEGDMSLLMRMNEFFGG